MTILTDIQQGPFTEIAVGVITALLLAVYRSIERGALMRLHKRELKKALLQPPPVDAPEQLAKLEAEENVKADSISNAIKPIVKNLLKNK